MTYSSEVLADSPFAFWKLDEASGTIVDSSGNSKTLTGVNSPTQSASGGPFAGAGCVTLNGTNQRLDSNAAPNSSEYAIEFWYKGTDGQATVASGRAGTSNYTIAVRIGAVPVGSAPAGCVNVGVSGNGTWSGAHTTTAVVNDNVWHHVVCVWDGTSGVGITPAQFAIYIDGVAQTLTQDPYNNPTAPIASAAYKFGDHPEDGPAPLAGSLSNIALYDTALTSTRVAAHYSAAAGSAPIAVAGDPAAATATALNGTPLVGLRVAGDAATATATALDGTIPVTVPIIVTGDPAAATASALDGLGRLRVAGDPATATATGLGGYFPGAPIIVEGEAASATAAALDGFAFTPPPRNGFGLILDSSAVLTVDDALETEPTVPAGTPSTVLHIVAPTVPVPTLVAGRPQ